MTKKVLLIIFFTILAVGVFLRFYQLGSVPGSLEWDEVSFGYNSYSILHTGKDEYGESLPLAFRAFGEYKQPVYVYLDAASIALFGLTSFAVRFPSALFGSLSIIFVYFLTRELFIKQPYARQLALIAMFSFALSPWSIQFSRGAFEANVSLSFIISGAWLFMRGLNLKMPSYLYFSTLLFILSTYTYISQKLIAPLLFIGLLAYGYSYFKKKKITAIALFIVFISLSSLWLFNTKSVSRGQGVIFTANQTQILAPTIKELQYDTLQNDLTGKLVHNRRVVYANTFLENYLSHFNPQWLFFTGDTINRHHAPNFGLLYLVSLPFIVAGIYFLLSRTFGTSWIIFVWFLCAPLAAALTFEAPHSLRSLIFLPTWQIFEAAGVIWFIQLLRKNPFGFLLKFFIAVLFVVNIVYYIHQYFIHTDTDFQKDWQFGYKEAIDALPQYTDGKKRIIFADTFEQPYIFYLYYTKYDPKKYIETGGSSRTAKPCFSIDNVYFGACHDKLRSGDIYVVTGEDEISHAKELKRFNYQTGGTATRILQYQ
jgi:4-amino-4-deoxy-L-arabinose transferase-like glycosyltransferase